MGTTIIKIKHLLLYLYLKTMGRLFVYIIACRHPNDANILFYRYLGKKAKKGWLKS